MRIAFAGFQHETNTFAPDPTGLAEFEMADSWPPLLQGVEALEGTRGLNLPIAGAFAAAEAAGDVEILPILWCAAEPSGRVTDAAFDHISGLIVAALRDAAVDGVMLDLHGAMVTERDEDGEGALLARIRDAIGPKTPIAVSLDLHANISDEMVRHAAQISVFRTYPHLDMAETGARAFETLQRIISAGAPAVAFRRAPFLVPLQAQSTDLEPCRSLYAALEDVAAPDESVELAMGFTAADIADCGPSIIAYAPEQERADALADAAFQRLIESEPVFDTALLSAEDGVRRAMDAHAQMILSGAPLKPVIIADVQDNPGAGGSSDTTGLLRALISGGARGAYLGLMHDPETAATAHRLGPGARFEALLGGRSGAEGDAPLPVALRVEALRTEGVPFTGEMYGGGVAEIGPSALLAIDGVDAEIKVIVCSVRNQCLDRGFFTAFDIDLAGAEIICVKSTAHFRADFAPIAADIINVAAPGLFQCAPAAIPYRALRDGVRLGPGGPVFKRV